MRDTPPRASSATNSSLTLIHSHLPHLLPGKLKRLNAIFERAADRRSGGIREDKILRILPSGTATKYGIDPDAVRQRLQLRREWQEENKRISAVVAKADGGKSNRCRRKKSRRNQQQDSSGDGEGETSAATTDAEQDAVANAAREALARLGPCPELRVLSRGTFLAMFANESNTFVNTMAQNDRADRERRSARRNNANATGRNPDGVANVGLIGGDPTRLQVMVAEPTPTGNNSLGLANGVLGEMTNHHPPNGISSQSSPTAGHQRYQLIPETNASPSSDMSSSPHNAGDYTLRSDTTGREEKAMRRDSRTRSNRKSSGRSGKNRRRAASSSSGGGGNAATGYHFDYNYEPTLEDDASISSLSTLGSAGAGRGTSDNLDRRRFGHHRNDSISTLSSIGADPYVDRSLNRSLSHDQEYFTNEFVTGNEDLNILSPESCNGSLAGSFGFSPDSTSSQLNHGQAHHSADAAAGGMPASPRQEIPSPPIEMKMGELQKPKLIERTKSDSSSRSNRRKKKRSGNSGSMRSRHSLDDSSSIGSGSYQSGGKLIGQSPSKEERKAMRRERRRRKEERRKAELQLERRQRELDASANIGTATSTAQYGQPLTYADSQQYHQPQFLSPALPMTRPPEQRFGTVPQRGVYNCEPNGRSEDEHECVFFSAICSILQKYFPVLASKKKVLVQNVPRQQPEESLVLPTQVPNVPGVVLPSSTSQQPMIGLTQLGQPLGGHHRRAASLTNNTLESPAHKFYVRHQRSNSIDGRLPPGYPHHQQLQHQYVGIVPLAAVAGSPSTPDLAGLAFLATPHKPMVPPPPGNVVGGIISGLAVFLGSSIGPSKLSASFGAERSQPASTNIKCGLLLLS